MEKLSLRAVRRASGRTLREVADEMGYSTPQQANNTEAREDWLVSTVAQYVAACGGTVTVTVKVKGQVMEFEL
ncbi:hypothetical protein [Mycolicibacterium septicum]|uniref:hypothetical protein n=1 Tax=Mycolicibacterium septicum TaxID=98668 RepID=UPI001AFA4CB2|nr:hypothetical protein [Mycolicibacterium septicum]QRY51770.1 hypothetical protein JVX95_31090 [Mycolicibacterium septicum]